MIRKLTQYNLNLKMVKPSTTHNHLQLIIYERAWNILKYENYKVEII